jgi:hypothetical protein
MSPISMPVLAAAGASVAAASVVWWVSVIAISFKPKIIL